MWSTHLVLLLFLPIMTSVNGSSVQEAFALMTTLLVPSVPMRYLEMCGKMLQRRQMEDIFQERAAAKLCAFPACENLLSKTSGKFRVSLARKAIYDAQYERQFCSPRCLEQARLLLSKLVHKPPQLVPSLVEVFGTDKPNPFDYNDDKKQVKDDAKIATHKSKPLPMAKTVWAKTQDLGVVERYHLPANAMSMGVSPALEATTPIKLIENESPAAPERNFPKADQASVIEGYIFPAHKERLAKKLEMFVKKSQENNSEIELELSDSDKSDAAVSEASSASSSEISDFDDNEVVKLENLPLFSHLWGLISNWVTHNTNLVVARLPLLTQEDENYDVYLSRNEMTKSEVDAALRRARQIHTERWNSLSLMLRRSLPQVALKVKLDLERFANHRIDMITKTFALRDAIDTRKTHLWTCLATILLLVTYDIKPKDLHKGERSKQIVSLTKLDTMELAQLLQLFYSVRKESDVVADDDIPPNPENKLDVQENMQTKIVADNLPPICRRCRRLKAKCICQFRVTTQTNEEFSPDQVGEMLREALILREEHVELLQSDK
ncbi:putative Rtr1/RPAP2 domain-containing protein [Plasmopara halstedii]